MATQTTALVTVQTRIESDLHERLSERAEDADRSLAAEVRQAIRAWVEQTEANKEAAA